MARKTLRDVLGPSPQAGAIVRWQVTVPLGTNLFLLIELLQFAGAGAVVVFLGLCVGARVTDGVLLFADVSAALQAAGTVLLAVVAAFTGISVLFFNNRYFATFQMDSGGIYQEGNKGRDDRRDVLCLRIRPYPVMGSIKPARTRSRLMPWEKLDSYHDIPSMRVIMLYRGIWHMVRLYTPDADTHEQVVDYLARRLKRR